MKKIFIISVCFLFGTQSLLAQKTLKFEIKEKKKEVIYFNLSEDKKELEFIVSDKDNELDSKKSGNSNINSINIYLKWINPLKYKLMWKDSILTDERDKAVTDFINSLVAQYGTPVTGLNKVEDKTKAGLVGDPTKIQTRNFKNMNLVVWLLHIMENKTEIEKFPEEVLLINSLSENLEKLDSLNSIDISKSVKIIYTALLAINDISEYNFEYPKQIGKVKDIEGEKSIFAEIESLQKTILADLINFKLSNTVLSSFTKSAISNYTETVSLTLNENKKIVQKLKPILEIVKASTANESSKLKGYYKIRSAQFEDGKKLETTLTITEHEFKKETTEFTKIGEVINKIIVFQKFDIFDVSVSTGIFYGNTTLKGFGIANDGTNFKVTEDNINKNSVVAAVFLNFNFKTSRYFSPMFQLGIDPTKKRPFLLFGGGFSIPVARIAFSTGPVWTWNQTLDKLTVGQTINSTTDLDKDIKYKFELEPKGWYLGIQYNF